MRRKPVERALISVFDKKGLVDLAHVLVDSGVEIVSSGGTAAVLADAEVPVELVADVTGAPEILDGRVKTLHPAIHAAILADRHRSAHMETLEESGYRPIDLVVVNLYPFSETVSQNAGAEEAIEQIDIGGPALIRAAAKNHAAVAVVVSPDQYQEVAAAVSAGGLTNDHRRLLAQAAFARTSSYDAAIAGWLANGGELPEYLQLQLHRASLLRYGENPHQEAAAYIAAGHSPWWARATQVQGKQMSFNNYRDADSAWRLVLEYEAPTAAVIKHMNPSGVASRPTLRSAFQGAWDCDPGSAYGSVVAVNQDLDSQTADLVADHFVEVLIAPSASPDALELLADRPRLRVLVAPPLGEGSLEYHEVDGGFLVQGRDRIITERDLWKVVSERAPSESEWTDLVFAWKVCGHVKSNAIVVANGETAVGIGGGDQSRVGAARRALDQAGQHSAGGVAASDAFLPFRDALDDLAAAGVRALVQPGGSRRDDEVIAAADTHGMSVVFTGRRHFRH